VRNAAFCPVWRRRIALESLAAAHRITSQNQSGFANNAQGKNIAKDLSDKVQLLGLVE
jgi:hypothetical protein